LSCWNVTEQLLIGYFWLRQQLGLGAAGLSGSCLPEPAPAPAATLPAAAYAGWSKAGEAA